MLPSTLTLALIPSAAAVLADVSESRTVNVTGPHGPARIMTLQRVQAGESVDDTRVVVSDSRGEWSLPLVWLAHAHAEGMYGHAR